MQLFRIILSPIVTQQDRKVEDVYNAISVKVAVGPGSRAPIAQENREIRNTYSAVAIDITVGTAALKIGGIGSIDRWGADGVILCPAI